MRHTTSLMDVAAINQSLYRFINPGIVATAIPIQLMLLGLQYVSALRASILSVFEPLMTVFMGVVFLNERLVSHQYIGISIILISVIIVQSQKR